MKIGFTGTRDGMSHPQWLAVKQLLESNPVEELHHGDCIGADEEVHQLAISLDIPKIVVHPPKDNKLRAYCQGHVTMPALPYLERDMNIVKATTHVIGAPRTKNRVKRSGTWQTIGYAEDDSKLWRVVFPDGIVVEG